MNSLWSIEDIISAILRHIILLAFIVSFGVAASLFYALSLPRTFETTAVIQIEQPEIQQTSGVASNAQTLQQLQIIEQRVMARKNIEMIISKYELFSEIAGLTQNQKIEAFREAARVTRVVDPTLAWRPDVTPTALNVIVALGDPDIAAAVANELVDNVLNENRSRRAQRARETTTFFDSEAARLGTEILQLEAQISEFKRENAENLGAGLLSLRDELVTLREEELIVSRELVEINSNQRGSSSTLVTTQVTRLEEQRSLLSARIEEIRLLVAAAPELERELGVLERELRRFTDQYQVVTRSQAEAEMRLMLEETEQSESFIVLERAVAPDLPVSPNRKLIALLGCALSGLLGLAIVAFLELRNPVIRTERHLEKLVGLKPVIMIPNVEIANEKVVRRALWVIGIAIAVCLFLVLLALITVG